MLASLPSRAQVIAFLDKALVAGVALLCILGGVCALLLAQGDDAPQTGDLAAALWGGTALLTYLLGMWRAGLAARTGA